MSVYMNTAKLEIFSDDINSPPHLSRLIPAALDGLIDDKTFQEFADQIDVLLGLLDAEHQRLGYRTSWHGQLFVFLYLFAIMLGNAIILLLVTTTWLIHFLFACYTTYWKKGPKSAYEIIEEIRSACELMTDRTPNVSFHPKLRSVPADARLLLETIENIDVNISDRAFGAVTTDDVVICIEPSNKSNTSTGISTLGNPSATTRGDYQPLETV